MAQHKVLCQVVGTVGYFAVADGARVEKGRLVCAVESMKTYFEHRAPVTGIVRLKVGLGETIGQNDVIAIVEDAE